MIRWNRGFDNNSTRPVISPAAQDVTKPGFPKMAVINHNCELSTCERASLTILSIADDWDVVDVSRIPGGGDYDLEISGTRRGGLFSARLKLAVIHALIGWTIPEIAAMTDYPAMCRMGDWSGVRDSSDEKIDAIFERFHGRHLLRWAQDVQPDAAEFVRTVGKRECLQCR